MALTFNRRYPAPCTSPALTPFYGRRQSPVNAYYRSAEQMGVQIRYNTPVQALELRDGEFVAALAGTERIAAKTCVLAAGGFESNREWLREARAK